MLRLSEACAGWPGRAAASRYAPLAPAASAAAAACARSALTGSACRSSAGIACPAALHPSAPRCTRLHAPLRCMRHCAELLGKGEGRSWLRAAASSADTGHAQARLERSAAQRRASFAPCNTPRAEGPRPHARARVRRMTPGPPRGAPGCAARPAARAARRPGRRHSGRARTRRRAARPPADRGRPAGAPRVARPPRRARSAAGRSRRPRRARPGPPPRSRSRCGSPPARPAAPRRRACARPASAGLLAGRAL